MSRVWCHWNRFPGYRLSDVPVILESAHPLRLFAAYSVLQSEGEQAIDRISQTTGYDRWFLWQMFQQTVVERQLETMAQDGMPLDPVLVLEAKRMGLSDCRIATLVKSRASQLAGWRAERGIIAVCHFVDTCAGEFPAKTPYCYTTYGETDEGEPLGNRAVLIVASGPNRIGQGLEFDTCCTLASLAYRRLGRKTIMVNSNPETVSTDFNISDRLYLEPLTVEHVRYILEKENTADVVLQLGGQTPLNMVDALREHGGPYSGDFS